MPRKKQPVEMWERPLTTRVGRLQFVLAFAQMNLETLQPQTSNALQASLAEVTLFGITPEPKRLQGDVVGFPPHRNRGGLNWQQRAARWKETDLRPNPAVYAMPGEFLLSYSELCALQAETLHILRTVAQPSVPSADGKRSVPMRWITFQHLQGCLIPLDVFVPAAKGNTWYIQGSPRDVFLFTLQFMLLVEPVDRIQTCPECTRLFYRHTRQKFCSPRCTSRVAVRHYRADPLKREAEADRAHQRYVKRKMPADRQAPLVVERRRRRQSVIPTGKEQGDGETQSE